MKIGLIGVWPRQPFGPRPPGRKTNIPKGTASNGYEAKFEYSYWTLHYIIYILSQTTNIEEISSLSFISEKISSLILGSKGKGYRFEKGKGYM